MLWVYDNNKIVYIFSAGITIRHQILTSIIDTCTVKVNIFLMDVVP